MPQDATHNASWKDRFSAELRRDKRKTAVLTALAAVAVVLLVRLALKTVGSAPPAQAEAASTLVSEPDDRSEGLVPVGPPVGGGPRSTDPVRSTAELTGRDLFMPDPQFFPPAEPVQTVVDSGQQDEDDKRQEDERLIRLQARALTLESTIVGDVPMAMINGSFVQQGERINGFQVRRITQRSCTLDKKGVTVVLEMESGMEPGR